MPGKHEALFSAVRGISAADAAERLNIQLHRRGDRSVALCPIHGEDTASLTFYPDRRFFCFGCHEHGGAIELYQKVLKVSALDAARALASDFNIIEQDVPAPAARRGPTAQGLKRVLNDFLSSRWDDLCFRKNLLYLRKGMIEDLLRFKSPEECADSEQLNMVIKSISEVEGELYLLEGANPAELLALAGGINGHD